MRGELFRIPFSGGEIQLELRYAGEDIVAVLSGGDRPHIGCAVVALPRSSLTGDGTLSCTSSVVNLIGHKDEYICRQVAEYICKKQNVTVVCTGGVHLDEAGEEQISEVVQAIRRFCEEQTGF